MSVDNLKKEISDLRRKLQEKEDELKHLQNEEDSENTKSDKLSNEDIARYSRQIIIPDIGMKGQLALKNSSVLIVGAGGLGCPSALYLCGAGIGHIGLVDYDEVEINNLHRQLLHSEDSLGQSKVQSATQALKRLNSDLKISPYHIQLDSSNALNLVKQFDVILDATDNVPTRYLLNDACVLAGRPLVSGSALQFEGQLTVYNYSGGPCYRCLFPVPPSPETVTNCGDGGVLGVVPGVIGVLQALEAIKIVLDRPGVLAGRWLVFDGADCTFRNIRLRNKNPACEACAEQPKITALVDYEQFCGAKANDKDDQLNLLNAEDRILATEYHGITKQQTPHILVDVRPQMEFEICHLTEAINIPLADLSKDLCLQKLKENIKEKCGTQSDFPVYVVCRRGNSSQKAVLQLKQSLTSDNIQVKDIVGGLHSWASDVDNNFPVY